MTSTDKTPERDGALNQSRTTWHASTHITDKGVVQA